jgi:hypothetical protein
LQLILRTSGTKDDAGARVAAVVRRARTVVLLDIMRHCVRNRPVWRRRRRVGKVVRCRRRRVRMQHPRRRRRYKSLAGEGNVDSGLADGGDGD